MSAHDNSTDKENTRNGDIPLPVAGKLVSGIGLGIHVLRLLGCLERLISTVVVQSCSQSVEVRSKSQCLGCVVDFGSKALSYG